jgi:hypothetical protein
MPENPLHQQVVNRRTQAKVTERLETAIDLLEEIAAYAVSIGQPAIAANLTAAQTSAQAALAAILA